MKAVLHERYGPPEVLHVGEVEPPVPQPDEVLVAVRASSVTRTDCGLRAARPFFATGLARSRSCRPRSRSRTRRPCATGR